MSRARLNALEVLKLLPRTNCRECGVATCLAFANQVALGQRGTDGCPYVAGHQAEEVRGLAVESEDPVVDDGDELLDELTLRVRDVDFAEVASSLGATMKGSSLAFRCLGKEFVVDERGRLRSQCHANFWVLVPLLDSIVRASERIDGKGGRSEPTGEWVKVDELRNVVSSTDFFAQSCEAPLRRLADRDVALFAAILEIFGARPGGHDFGADLSLVIHPQPKVPLLVCYWKPDESFDSKLGIYFDRTAEEHLSIEGIYILMTGLVDMLKRITARHTFSAPGS